MYYEKSDSNALPLFPIQRLRSAVWCISRGTRHIRLAFRVVVQIRRYIANDQGVGDRDFRRDRLLLSRKRDDDAQIDLYENINRRQHHIDACFLQLCLKLCLDRADGHESHWQIRPHRCQKGVSGSQTKRDRAVYFFLLELLELVLDSRCCFAHDSCIFLEVELIRLNLPLVVLLNFDNLIEVDALLRNPLGYGICYRFFRQLLGFLRRQDQKSRFQSILQKHKGLYRQNKKDNERDQKRFRT